MEDEEERKCREGSGEAKDVEKVFTLSGYGGAWVVEFELRYGGQVNYAVHTV